MWGRRVGQAAIVLGTVAASTQAPAGIARAETTIDGEVGVRGHAERGDHLVVRVQVTADELIDGAVVVSRGDGGGTVVRRPVQVPAGTTKELLLITPSGAFSDEVTVDVRDGGRLVATRDLRVRFDSDVELVGLLPRLVARSGEVPEQVTLPSGTGRAELAAVPLDVLALGPLALQGYDTIVGAGDDVAGLDVAARTALLVWVHEGGRLLLDDAGGLDALPAPWRPGAAGYAFAGRGEVRTIDGAAAAGRWVDVLEPSGPSAGPLDVGVEAFAEPQRELAQRAGLRLPTLAPLVIVLAVYGLAIGPVLYLVLRRSRRLTLAWIAIPVLAVATAGGIVVAGDRYRTSGRAATATFVETSPPGALGLSNVLSFSRSGGTEDVGAPPGWLPDESTWWGVDFGRTAVFTMNDDGTGVLDQGLEAGEATTALFSGPLPAEDLEITAAVGSDGRIAGTVRNGTGVTLHDVAVFAGNDAVALGPLAPGATTAWEADAPTAIELFSTRGDRVWGGPFGQPAEADQVAELGIWGTASLHRELFAPGLARVVGWTAEPPAPVDVGDGEASNRTGISAVTPIDPAGRPPEPATVRAAVVRSPFGPFSDGTGDAQVYRYVLPPGAAPAELVLEGLPRNTFGEVTFWDGADWQEAEEAIAIPVPATAVRGGTVLVRVWVAAFVAGDPNVIPTLQAAP